MGEYKSEEIPEWAKDTINKLIAQKFLKGDENGNLDLSYDMLRILTILSNE
jgi:hypothetical protein